MSNQTETIWTDDLIAELTDLWIEGLPTAQIGRIMGITKNAVLGKAHRIGLPPRDALVNAIKGMRAKVRTTETAAGPCRFPMWDHQEPPTHVFCDKPRREGSSYCHEHHSLCHLRNSKQSSADWRASQ